MAYNLSRQRGTSSTWNYSYPMLLRKINKFFNVINISWYCYSQRLFLINRRIGRIGKQHCLILGFIGIKELPLELRR
ncbi:hypothetical protein D3C72_2140220 [compost metagenome]